MGKLSELTTKAVPIGADLITGLDSEDTNVQTKNKNFLLSGIWAAVFGSRDTDDIPEGSTNKYYSDALVNANSTVVSLGTDKADKTNVIEKDSTTPFTPTLGTHPANKDYVDNFSLPDATEVIKGKARLATDAEISAGTDNTTIVTPSKIGTLVEPLFTTIIHSNTASSTTVFSSEFSFTQKTLLTITGNLDIATAGGGESISNSLQYDNASVWTDIKPISTTATMPIGNSYIYVASPDKNFRLRISNGAVSITTNSISAEYQAVL